MATRRGFGASLFPLKFPSPKASCSLPCRATSAELAFCPTLPISVNFRIEPRGIACLIWKVCDLSGIGLAGKDSRKAGDAERHLNSDARDLPMNAASITLQVVGLSLCANGTLMHDPRIVHVNFRVQMARHVARHDSHAARAGEPRRWHKRCPEAAIAAKRARIEFPLCGAPPVSVSASRRLSQERVGIFGAWPAAWQPGPLLFLVVFLGGRHFLAAGLRSRSCHCCFWSCGRATV